MNFSDYEQVFNNFSVPVSCCDTTNPLFNETTCPDIVMDTNVTTELIYTEVVHHCSVNDNNIHLLLSYCRAVFLMQVVSYFHYIHSVYTVGIIPLTAVISAVTFVYICFTLFFGN